MIASLRCRARPPLGALVSTCQHFQPGNVSTLAACCSRVALLLSIRRKPACGMPVPACSSFSLDTAQPGLPALLPVWTIALPHLALCCSSALGCTPCKAKSSNSCSTLGLGFSTPAPRAPIINGGTTLEKRWGTKRRMRRSEVGSRSTAGRTGRRIGGNRDGSTGLGSRERGIQGRKQV